MLSSIRRKLAGLKSNTSGNATLLVALGMPVLIGCSGLAVDTAQWYMWKREIQNGADQAALAGAWARSSDSSSSVYVTRARQEFSNNTATTTGIDTTPAVELADYSGGHQNSVIVRVSATKRLPFSSMMTGQATTVSVYAQAAYTEGNTYTACLIGLNDDGTDVVVGGTATLTARCGIAALSHSDASIVINGNPTVDPGWVVSAGGIDSWLSQHTDAEIHEYMSGLADPFADTTAPNPASAQTPRTYSCVKGTTTTKSHKTTDISATYTYYKGLSPDANNDGALTTAELSAATWTQYDNAKGKSKQTSTSDSGFIVVSNDTVDGVTTTTTRTITKTNNSTGANATWEMKTTVTTTTYSGTTSTTTPDLATTLPGTYSGGIKVSCTTVFAKGIYVIDGGGLEIDGQYEVTGAAVMFVLKNGAYVKINGGSNINLTAMQVSDLTSVGVSATDAAKLAGMLIYEDRNSSGSNQSKINGNSVTVMNGKIYLPKSQVTFNGTANVTSACLLIAAAQITLEGDTNMNSFCPAGMQESDEVATGVASVKLVA